MKSDKWVLLDKVNGSFKAEILKGLLEAQGIETMLSQEGAAHYGYALTIGPMGEVEILVPSRELEHARQVLADYEAGKFESPPENDE
ncbi:MAG: DUF2007 domain-containing protein [Anaerolineales bacterium]|jgi:hypothetical protein